MTRDPTYYEPPSPWNGPAIAERYRLMTANLRVNEPRNLDSRVNHPLIQTNFALHQISLGIKAGDQACILIGTDFVVSPAYFSGSGYIKAGMARRLKTAPVDESTKSVLRVGIDRLWSSGHYRVEFRDYVRLLRSIGLGSSAKKYRANAWSYHPGVRFRLAAVLGPTDAA